mgnify:FL=1
MLNQIFIMGRLARDPEVRHTQSGVTVCSFTLAVDRDIKDKQTGERKTDWIPVTAWRGTADRISRYVHKGDSIVVVGRLEIQEWTDRQGNKRTTPNVSAENVYFTGGRRQETAQSYQQQEHEDQQEQNFEALDDDQTELPF